MRLATLRGYIVETRVVGMGTEPWDHSWQTPSKLQCHHVNLTGIGYQRHGNLDVEISMPQCTACMNDEPAKVRPRGMPLASLRYATKSPLCDGGPGRAPGPRPEAPPKGPAATGGGARGVDGGTGTPELGFERRWIPLRRALGAAVAFLVGGARHWELRAPALPCAIKSFSTGPCRAATGICIRDHQSGVAGWAEIGVHPPGGLASGPE